MENRKRYAVLLSEGDVIITMDADLQDSPMKFLVYQMIVETITIWFPVGKKRYDSN